MAKLKSKSGRKYKVEAIKKDECIIYDVTNPFKKKIVTTYAGQEDETEENLRTIEKYERTLKG